MQFSELNTISDLLTYKQFRDKMCTCYINENKMITDDIINYFNLQRINHKYILGDRMYTENSYSKKKIKCEESQYLLLCSLIEPFIYNIEKQLLLRDNFNYNQKYDRLEGDISIYKKLSAPNQEYLNYVNITNIITTKSDIYRIDIFEQLLSSKKVRGEFVARHIENNYKLVELIVSTYNLKWLNDKYITCHKSHDTTHYARTKIADQEIFMLKKIFMFTTWNTYQQDIKMIYHFIECELSKLGVDNNKLLDFFSYISNKYFNLFSSHELPMNQISSEMIKIN